MPSDPSGVAPGCIRSNPTGRYEVKVTRPTVTEIRDGCPFHIVAFRAVQGHNENVYNRFGAEAIGAQALSLDTEYDIRKLDRGERPRFNPKPDMDWDCERRTLGSVVYTNAIMYIAEEMTLTAHLETALRLSRGGATMEDDAPDDLVSEDNV